MIWIPRHDVDRDESGMLATGPVGDLLYPPTVVEFYLAPDFYQLRLPRGPGRPEHRWRHERAAGWSLWQPSNRRWFAEWFELPAILVSTMRAEANPMERWMRVESEAVALP